MWIVTIGEGITMLHGGVGHCFAVGRLKPAFGIGSLVSGLMHWAFDIGPLVLSLMHWAFWVWYLPNSSRRRDSCRLRGCWLGAEDGASREGHIFRGLKAKWWEQIIITDCAGLEV